MSAKFHQATFKTERLVCVATHGHLDIQTNGHQDKAMSIPIIQNIREYIFFGVGDIFPLQADRKT